MGYWPTPTTPNCSKKFISALTITGAQWSNHITARPITGLSVKGNVGHPLDLVLEQGVMSSSTCFLRVSVTVQMLDAYLILYLTREIMSTSTYFMKVTLSMVMLQSPLIMYLTREFMYSSSCSRRTQCQWCCFIHPR